MALSKGTKDKRSSYAEEGTECHEAAANVLMGFALNDVCAFLSDDQKWIVEEYTNYVFDTLDMLHDKFGSKNVKVWVEERVRSNISEDYHGTADFAALAGRTLGIIDLKAGYGPVTTRNEDGSLNEQLASYAICFLDEHDLWRKVDKVRLTIVQPRVYEKPQTIVVDIQELVQFAVKVDDNIAAIEDGDVHLEPGKWCKFCPARGKCPALRTEAVNKSRLVFNEPKHAREYTPDELEEILEEAELIQAHIDGIRMHVRMELEKGREFKNWKLVPKRAMSKWIDFDAVRFLLKEKYHLQDGKLHTFKPKTPNQLLKTLKEVKVPTSVIDGFWHKESSGTTLARKDDARPATKPDPFED